jgi:nucleotide-binding universal stress UspA family protein
MHRLARLIVPLDTSVTAERVLPWAALMARDRAMDVHLVTVWDPDSPIPGMEPGASREAIVSQLEGYLAGVAARLREDVRPVSSEVRVGAVVDEIRAAAEGPGNLVLLASHGQGGYQEARIGSIAEKLIQKLRVPVLVIPADEPTR